MSASGSKFSCSSCNRSYAWKPQLAGKKVRCKCGAVVAVPPSSDPPASPAPELDDLYELAGEREEKAARTPQPAGGGAMRCPACQSDVEPGAVLCLSCGMNFKTGKKMRTTVGGPDLPAAALARPAVARPALARPTIAQPAIPMPGGVAQSGVAQSGVAPAAVAGGVPRTLGYAGRNPRIAQKEDEDANASLKQLTVPIILVVVGLALAVTRAMLAFDLSLPAALMVTGVLLAVEMVLITIGCLIAIKVLDIALGTPAEAFLKIGAVALLPGAVVGLIEWKFELAGAMVGWGVALALYYGLLKLFFDLELFEVMILTVIIWLIRTWIGMVIVAVILSIIMGGSASNFASGPMTMMMGGGGRSEILMDGSPVGRNNTQANRLLMRSDATDAQAFIDASANHTVVTFDHAAARKMFEELYAAGAEEIWVAEVFTFGQKRQADKVIVVLPDEPELRAKIFPIWKDHFAPMDVPAIDDMGEDQAYLILHFDGNAD